MISNSIFRSNAAVIVSIFLFFLLITAPSLAAIDQHKHDTEDLQAIEAARNSMQATINFIDAHPEIFPPVKIDGVDYQLDIEQRMVARQTWQNFLDHILFFDSMGQIYSDKFMDAAGDIKKKTFTTAFACFLAQYRFALDYIDRMERNPAMHVMLNEAVPELGLKKGTYARMKFRFLNVIRGAEFARLNVLYTYYKNTQNPLRDTVEKDIAAIWASGKGKGPKLTAQNAMKIVTDFGLTSWFPVQKEVSQLMGNTKVHRHDISLITPEQIEQLAEKLQPGDIMLQRREWYASNIGIPGFWTHAALYIGTPEERTAFFHAQIPAGWFINQGSEDGTLDGLLRNRYPEFYQMSITQQEEGHIPRVIEAIGKGVSFTTLEHSASADSIVVLRSILPQKDIAEAILKAFHYSKRPYDFNFDFRTDSELVCSELIYKAYQKTGNSGGLSFPLSEVLGRPLISPNEIAQLFDEEFGTKQQQLELITFLDGNEKELKALESTVEEFRISWKRPKWYIWLQGDELDMSSYVAP